MFLTEIFRMALGSLRTNKLRSALTMLGVAIGVFSVIGVMTSLSAIQDSIETGLSFLGSNIFQFAKYPVINNGGRAEEKYRNRKDISLDNANEFVRLMEGQASAIALKCFDGGRPVSYGRVTLQGRTIVGTNQYFTTANSYAIGYGRNISQDDVEFGRPVTVVGASIQKKLFPSQTPIGKTISVNYRPYVIIGVLDEKGSSFGNSQDELVLVPITKFFSDFGHENRTINLAIQSTSQATYNDTLDKAIGAMRAARGLKLGQENDFEIYSNDTLLTAFAQVADIIRVGAFVISAIALLAAGIGIMNIMLVSVTERTREIGIRKAIGARRYDVLIQFLIEAVTLSGFGGIIGIAGGYGTAALVRLFLKRWFELPPVHTPLWAIVLAFMFCAILGIIFGIYPAAKASKLDPIEALRYE